MQDGEGPLGNLIAGDRLERLVEDGVRPWVRGTPRAVARALVRHLRERNFILCYAGGDSYAFVHRTFLEYFCADDLIRRFEHEKSIDIDYLKEQIFGQRWADETWQEVLCLAAGMVHSAALEKILTFLRDRPDPYMTFRHVFLGARCVGERRTFSELGGVAESIRQALMRLPDLNVHLGYESGESTVSLDSVVRTRAVMLLARVWREHPETAGWLKTLVRSHRFEDVRRAAVRALAEGWKDDPATLPWLLEHGRSDGAADVRRGAVVALARNWRDDPATLPLLQDRARHDGADEVRGSALEALAEGWKDDPATLPLLQDRTRHDETLYVRHTAAGALARAWKDDPDIMAWLEKHGPKLHSVESIRGLDQAAGNRE